MLTFLSQRSPTDYSRNLLFTSLAHVLQGTDLKDLAMTLSASDQPITELNIKPKLADDFPYYAGDPVAFNGLQWLLIVASLA